MTLRATRRGLLAGTVAGAALPALARAQGPAKVAPMRATQTIVRLGRALAVSPRGDRAVIAHDRRRTIAIGTPGGGEQRIVDVGGRPVDVAISPDGRLAAVTTGFWDGPGLAIVDLSSGAVRRLDAGRAPGAVAFAAGRLLVAGGEQEGALRVLETKGFTQVAEIELGLVPRGLAPGGPGRAWVALNGEARVALVDLHAGRVVRTLRTPGLPDRVALSPDGARLLVSHGGPGADHVSEIAVASGRVQRHEAGPLPSAVAWTRRGRRLVALGGASEVLVLGRGRPRRIAVAPGPRGLAVAGSRAWTVSAITGELSAVRA